ncbi:hypothetical protein ACFE04_010051 [Oxalis oulophora]
MGSILQAIIPRSSISEDRSSRKPLALLETMFHCLRSALFVFLLIIIFLYLQVTGGFLEESREALAIAETDGKNLQADVRFMWPEFLFVDLTIRSLRLWLQARQIGSSPVMSLRLIMDQSLQIL